MDLSRMTPDDIASLRAQLGLTDTSGRSPLKPRQLHDLRLLPTKDDPRPTFFWSAEAPRNVADLTKTSPYPKLLWEPVTGTEVTAQSPEEHETLYAGYLPLAPATAVLDPQAELEAQFAS